MATLVASLFGRLTLDDSDYQKGLDRAEKRSGSFGKNVAKAFLPVATALTAMGGYSIKAAVSFESAFAGVRKTVNATESELADLRKGILELARSADSPVSGLENAQVALAGIAEQAGQLGVANENLLKFTETIAMLQMSTNLGDDAAASLAQFANIVGMSLDNIDRLGSVIVGLGNNLATTERDIVEFMQRVAGAASQVGFAEGEIAAWSGAMASVGLNAEAGGTAFSRVVNDITSAIAKGGQELSDFAGVAGMSSQEFARAWQQDASGALQAFVAGLSRMDASQQINIMDALGLSDVRVMDTFRRLAGGVDVLNSALGMQNTLWQENNALTHEAEQRAQTTAAQWNRFKNNMNDLAISLGDALLPSVNKFIDLLNQGIDNARALGSMFGLLALGIQTYLAPQLDAIKTFLDYFKGFYEENGLVAMFTEMFTTLVNGQTSIEWLLLKLGFSALAAKKIADFVNMIGMNIVEATQAGGVFAQGVVLVEALWRRFHNLVGQTKDFILTIQNFSMPDIARAAGQAAGGRIDSAVGLPGFSAGAMNMLGNSPLGFAAKGVKPALDVAGSVASNPNAQSAAMDMFKNSPLGFALTTASKIFRDSGGMGRAGTPYMIGTGAQPELFIPSSNGSFVPNANMGTTINMGGVYIQANSEAEGRAAARGWNDELQRRGLAQGFSVSGVTG